MASRYLSSLYFNQKALQQEIEEKKESLAKLNRLINIEQIFDDADESTTIVTPVDLKYLVNDTHNHLLTTIGCQEYDSLKITSSRPGLNGKFEYIFIDQKERHEHKQKFEVVFHTKSTPKCHKKAKFIGTEPLKPHFFEIFDPRKIVTLIEETMIARDNDLPDTKGDKQYFLDKVDDALFDKEGFSKYGHFVCIKRKDGHITTVYIGEEHFRMNISALDSLTIGDKIILVEWFFGMTSFEKLDGDLFQAKIRFK